MELTVRKLYKEYRTFASFGERAACALSLGAYAGSIRVRALNNLEFSAGQGGGEILGVIGANGAGKSTLLRLLSGNSDPSSGEIRFKGSVRSILELGVGFSQELSGRQNVHYNGRLWGYTGSQLDHSGMAEILEFAQLQDFADRPFKSYSTGMQMRLGFALAAFKRSDLLLVDEALAVGDAAFQQKCLQRFREFREAGSIVIVVGHDLNTLRGVCDRLLLLDRGRCVALGPPAEVVEAYMQLIAEGSADIGRRPLHDEEFQFRLLDHNGQPREHFFTGERCVVEVELQPAESIQDATVGIHLNDATGLRVFGTNSQLMGSGAIHFPGGQRKVARFDLAVNLGPGRYTAGFSIHRGRAHGQDCYIWQENPLSFDVELPAGVEFEGLSFMDPRLTLA